MKTKRSKTNSAERLARKQKKVSEEAVSLERSLDETLNPVSPSRLEPDSILPSANGLGITESKSSAQLESTSRLKSVLKTLPDTLSGKALETSEICREAATLPCLAALDRSGPNWEDGADSDDDDSAEAAECD